ncbi:MAG: hypothetical protein C0508_19835, partial [Cyanobacteria bacterium PR.023]|nr:hypothetical protein [Cyanobacteria bacterium PR.023]
EDYFVNRDATYRPQPLYSMHGSTVIKLDYLCGLWKRGFWVLEAKESGKAKTKPPISSIGQAFSYSIHTEIDAPYFAVSNGWWFLLYDRDKDPTSPVLEIEQVDLEHRFDELRSILAAEQITFHLKNRLIKRIEDVLSADCFPERIDEFVQHVTEAADRARPRVNVNLGKVYVDEMTNLNESWEQYLNTLEVENLAVYPLNQTLTRPKLLQLSNVIVNKLRQTRRDQAFLMRLCLEEPRVVISHYYFHSLYVLGTLATTTSYDVYWIPPPLRREPGRKTATYIEIFNYWAELLLHHLTARPELRALWLLEAFIGRVGKRLLVYLQAGRTGIVNQQKLMQYFLREEELTTISSSPALHVILIIEGMKSEGMGMFLRKHFDFPNRHWNAVLAEQEYNLLELFEQQLREATPDYEAVLESLGSKWHEIPSLDIINTFFDELGNGVCNTLAEFPMLLAGLSQPAKDQVELLAKLNYQGALDCCKQFDLEIEPVDKLAHDTALASFFKM